MAKKFTILTASYNCGRYLMELADSVISQTYRPIEAILVDDKSNDNTLKIVEKISKKYKKANIEFKFIQPLGKLYCGSSYNLALKNATGKYFGVLDSDDALESFACEFIADTYERYPEVAWIYTQYNKYNRTMTRILKRGFCHCPPRKETLLSREKKNINTFSHWRTFSYRLPNRKSIFKKRLRGCVDKYMGFRMEELGIGMFFDKVCYRYRTRNRGEKPISYFEPLRRLRVQVIQEAKRRRRVNNIKCFPIIKCKA